MIRLSVPEMSCGHCTAAIEAAIATADGAATVACNLDDRSVSITSSLTPEALQAAIATAGYESTQI